MVEVTSVFTGVQDLEPKPRLGLPTLLVVRPSGMLGRVGQLLVPGDQTRSTWLFRYNQHWLQIRAHPLSSTESAARAAISCDRCRVTAAVAAARRVLHAA